MSAPCFMSPWASAKAVDWARAAPAAAVTAVMAMADTVATPATRRAALFMVFNVDGDPKKAQGYFKTTGDVVVDPPASSGKTTFTITRTP